MIPKPYSGESSTHPNSNCIFVGLFDSGVAGDGADADIFYRILAWVLFLFLFFVVDGVIIIVGVVLLIVFKVDRRHVARLQGS
jgi:hypothetical protein